MGCLNSDGKFDHWFGNIHLSGPCNRSCYFCIGQHMMALDPMNNLQTWPLEGLADFVTECNEHGIGEVNVTGSNTDPLLYTYTRQLKDYLQVSLYNPLIFGLRTNGALLLSRQSTGQLYDKMSVTICSLNDDTYAEMMGHGRPPDMDAILDLYGSSPVKVNIVLGPENVDSGDVFRTVEALEELGVTRINLREPYGQPHIGNPYTGREVFGRAFAMPTYKVGDALVTYWDVHYVHVESVNLYATGRVSVTYPISKGHDPAGEVHDQSQFTHGRQREQWATPLHTT